MVYAQSIEDFKLSRISINLKRSRPSEKNQPRFKKMTQIQDEPRDTKVKLDKGNGSQGGKPICATFGKKHYGKFLIGNGNFSCCSKDGHKVRDCPTIASSGKKSSVLGNDAPKGKDRFYALWARGSKPDDEDDDGNL